MENFKPSLDWGNELVPSLLWILRTYAITAVASLVVLVLLARFTVWGRQYWRVTGDYFKGRKSIGVWIWVAVLVTWSAPRTMCVTSMSTSSTEEANV